MVLGGLVCAVKGFFAGFGMEGESAIRMRFWAAGAEGASDGGDGLGDGNDF
jgi:hypothetical protein